MDAWVFAVGRVCVCCESDQSVLQKIKTAECVCGWVWLPSQYNAAHQLPALNWKKSGRILILKSIKLFLFRDQCFESGDSLSSTFQDAIERGGLSLISAQSSNTLWVMIIVIWIWHGRTLEQVTNTCFTLHGLGKGNMTSIYLFMLGYMSLFWNILPGELSCRPRYTMKLTDFLWQAERCLCMNTWTHDDFTLLVSHML